MKILDLGIESPPKEATTPLFWQATYTNNNNINNINNIKYSLLLKRLLQPFQLLEYQWSEGELIHKQTSSDPPDASDKFMTTATFLAGNIQQQ